MKVLSASLRSSCEAGASAFSAVGDAVMACALAALEVDDEASTLSLGKNKSSVVPHLLCIQPRRTERSNGVSEKLVGSKAKNVL